MVHELWADPGFTADMARLPKRDQATVMHALRTFVEHPLEHPKASRLHGSAYPGSVRLRVGGLRVLALVLASQGLILVTTVFRKKRASDYDQALLLHDRRLAAQGPPLADYLRKARRQR